MKKITTRSWIKFGIVAVLYLLFTWWVTCPWLLLGLPLIADFYLTKYINWRAWRNIKNPAIRSAFDWIEDIAFALVAVYIINLFVFQNYQIPTSSLEKTMLVGDYLFVSKLSYGPRIPNTPISFPLVQNTLPIVNTKSYLEWPNWGYKRAKGFGQVERNNIVVFNFPAGDTVALKVQNPDYYDLCYRAGREEVWSNKAIFGDIVYRPVDKRENYVKRCIGMPGDSLQIINNQVYIDGQKLENPKDMQLNYFIQTNGGMITEEQFRALGISVDDRYLVSSPNDLNYLVKLGFEPNANGELNPVYDLPLTQEALAKLQQSGIVKNIMVEPNFNSGDMYPLGANTGWTRDNYGPIWIPKKGATINLTKENLELYTRCIRNYENNTLEVKEDGTVLINGKPETTFTFKYDYYFMLGDNRHKSADSRYWGFVPEDHVIGKPILVWLSIDKDRSWGDGRIRWNRLFTRVDNK